jgi:branched-subunit amino acid ABC-type transport system permease component
MQQIQSGLSIGLLLAILAVLLLLTASFQSARLALVALSTIPAVLVGVVRGITTFFYPPASEASMYVLMILVLLLRPRGLLGERIERFE